MTSRLFIAAKIPEDILKEIDLIRREILSDRYVVKWEPVDKMHLTLKFLGDVSNDLIPEIENELDEILRGQSKIMASYSCFGFFLPRILFLMLNSENRLFDIARALEEKLENHGITREKRNFKAHITLLRIRQRLDDKLIRDFKEYTLPHREFHLGEISLIKSRLLPEGSVYTDIKKNILI